MKKNLKYFWDISAGRKKIAPIIWLTLIKCVLISVYFFPVEVSQIVLPKSFPLRSWQRLNKSTEIPKSWIYIFLGLQVQSSSLDMIVWESRSFYYFI